MSISTSDMESELEKNTGIRFHVSVTIDKGDLGYLIRPTGANEGLFKIKAVYRNKTRLIEEFIPLYSEFVKSLQHGDRSRKELFIKYAERLSEGKSSSISANGKDLLTNENVWDEEWFKFGITMSKIIDGETTDTSPMVVEWSTSIVLMMLALLDTEQEYEEAAMEMDGKEKAVIQNKYERNPINRRACIELKGCACLVCGMDFEKTYGSIGKGFIHVHHVNPVSKMGGPKKINPLKDLVPVCPNCHYMMHRRDPPYTVEELKIMMMREDLKSIKNDGL